MGKVGDDPFGVFLRESLAVEGIDTSYLFTDPAARTTAVFVAVWDDGRKDLCFYRNPGADINLNGQEITDALFEGARCFHFGSISFIHEPGASAQRKAIGIAQAKGLMICYDPNYRPTLWPDVKTAQHVIRDSFRYCHLAKVSEEEFEVATGFTDIEGGIRWILNQGVEMVVVSRGGKGAIAATGRFRIEAPACAMDVVETTGAGDGFMAAMISKMLPHRERLGTLADVDERIAGEALRYASAVGGLACTKPGAIPALPTAAEVDAFIAKMRRS